MYAAQDKMQPDAPSLWCSTCAVLARACYTWCCDRKSVHFSLRCRDSQSHPTFIAMSVSLRNDLGNPIFTVWDWRVSRAGPMPFYWTCCSLSFCLLLFSLSFRSFFGWHCWAGIFGLPDFTLPAFYNNNNNNKMVGLVIAMRVGLLMR